MADFGAPLIGGLASIGSSLIGGYFANQAADAQAKALRYAADKESKNLASIQGMYAPAINAGNTARDYQLGAVGLPGGVGYDEAMAAFRASPGYEFTRNQGLNGVQTSAAANGSLFSGATAKALQKYGTNLADQEFGNWYGRLGGISGAGDSAMGTVANAGTNTANSLSNIAARQGDARASSYGTTANAIGSGLQNIANLYAYYNPPQARTTYTPGAPISLLPG
jgi:hypothetical protein